MFHFVDTLKDSVTKGVDDLRDSVDKLAGHEEKKGVSRVSPAASHINLMTEKAKLSDYYEMPKNPIKSVRFENTFLCKQLSTHEYRCVKVMNKKTFSKDFFWTEVETYKKLVHPNVLHLYETIEGRKNYYCVVDRLDRPNLYQAVPMIFKNASDFDEIQVALTMRCILKTLMFCHQQGIVHSALTYEDILVDPAKGLRSLYICGFGYARLHREYRIYRRRGYLEYTGDSFETGSQADSFRDSARSQASVYSSDSDGEESEEHEAPVETSDMFAAPETRMGDMSVFDEPSADIWSVGVIAYQLLTRRNSFEDKDIWPSNFRDLEWKEDHFANAPYMNQLSKEAKDFVSKLLTYQLEDRPTAEEALKHPWLKCCEREGNRIRKDVLHAALTNLSNFHASSQLEQVTRMYIVNNLLSSEDRAQLDACFRYLDKGRNNVITRDELSSALKKDNPTDKVVRIDIMLEDIFDRIDVQNDGAIDYSEFLAAAADNSVVLTREHLRATFNAFDKSKTGAITVDDLKKLFNEGRDKKVMHSRDARRLIAQVDHDGDGVISFEEFCGLMHARETARPPGPAYGGNLWQSISVMQYQERT